MSYANILERIYLRSAIMNSQNSTKFNLISVTLRDKFIMMRIQHHWTL